MNDFSDLTRADYEAMQRKDAAMMVWQDEANLKNHIKGLFAEHTDELRAAGVQGLPEPQPERHLKVVRD